MVIVVVVVLMIVLVVVGELVVLVYLRIFPQRSLGGRLPQR